MVRWTAWRRTCVACLAFLTVILATVAAGAGTILVDGRDRVPLSSFEILYDPGRALTVADIRGDFAARFVPDPWTAEGRSLGFTADAVWLRAELLVLPGAAGNHVLILDVPNFDRLEVWGSWTNSPNPLVTMGDRVAGAMPARQQGGAIVLPAGRQTMWLRAVTSGSMAVKLDLWRPDALEVAEHRNIQIHTALTTFAVLLGLVALLLAATLRSVAMVLYAGSALATASYIVMMTGLDTLMWGRHLLDNDNPFIWQVVAGLFGMGFLFAALPLRHQGRWAVPVLAAPVVVAGILLALYCLNSDQETLAVVVLGPRNLTLMILAAGIAASLRSRLGGYRPATYLILGWLALAAGNVGTALRNAGAIPWTDASYYLPVYAPLAEMLLFGAMLAARLSLLRTEKETAQRSLMEALRRNEAELAERVAQRTLALDHANAALRNREEQLRLILEAAPLPILLSHAVTPVALYANRRARTLLLGDEETMAAPADVECYHDPADHDRVLTLLDRDGRVENIEVEMRDLAGGRFWALLSVVTIDYEGQPARLLAINDISRRRQLEQELIKSKEMADAAAGLERAAREAQRQFLAMITHEFRTPLAVISVAAQHLELNARNPDALERLARVGRAVRHMNGMIDACLLDDRIEGAGLVLRSERFDLAALVRRVADAASAAAPHHVLAIVIEGPQEVAGDEQLLGIALSNLMENAVKYSRPGSVVAVTLKEDGDDAVVTVADQGPGVPEEERERIFEKYYRCAGTGRVPGAGLGLYLTRRIVTAHGGAVGVRSRPEGGALFTLRLPVRSTFAAEQDSAGQIV